MGLCFCLPLPLKRTNKEEIETEEKYGHLIEEEEEETYSNMNEIEQELMEQPQQDEPKVVYFEKEKKEKILFKYNKNLMEIEPSKYQELWKEFNKIKIKEYKLKGKIKREQVENKFKEYNIFMLAVGEVQENNFKYYFYSEFNLILFLGECNINNNDNLLILKLKSNVDEHLNLFFLNFENIFDI
eukprot:gene5391-9204_t